jgi:hypothetical protein
MRALLLLIAACSSAATSTSAQRTTQPPPRTELTTTAQTPEPLPFGSACVAPGDPSIAEVQARAAAATKQGFDAELARQHLHVLALGTHSEHIADGLSYRGGVPAGIEVKRKLDTASGTFVSAETAWSGNPGTGPAAWEFVQNDRGDVYRLIRQPRAGVTKVSLCGCRPHSCGNPGSGCPACGSTSQTMYGPLPKDAHYKGELVLGFPANVVSLEYAQTAGCPPPPDCPQPP